MKTSHRWLLIGSLAALFAGTLGATGVSLLAWYALRTPSGGTSPWMARFDGWRRHTDPMGFMVEVPGDWTVRPDAATGRVDLEGPAGERVLAWPVYSKATLQPRSAGALLTRLARRLDPATRWGAAETLEPRAVRVRGTTPTTRATGLFAWVGSARGSSGVVYLLQAPARDRSADARLTRIVASFRLSGQSAATTTVATPRYERWTDPREGAFSAEIPAGWKASGGTVRPTLLLVQARLEAASPDGETTFSLGDNFPVYLEPNAILAQAGIGPGGTYPDAMGQPTPVAAYMPGINYALRAVLPGRVGAVASLRRGDRPDVAARLARLGMNRYDAGEAEYAFERNGREYRGWVLCITERVAAPALTHWHVWRLLLVEAPAPRFAEARDLLVHAMASFRIDAEWARRQARLTADQVQIVTAMGQAVSQTLDQAYDDRQTTLDEIHRRGANARREVEQVVDTLGRETTVESGSSYYWVDNRGLIVGTQTDTRPGLDFQELIRRP
jgi:hypothetical protein